MPQLLDWAIMSLSMIGKGKVFGGEGGGHKPLCQVLAPIIIT